MTDDQTAKPEPYFDGALCRGARALLGMSQADLSTAAGCGRKLVNDFENDLLVPKATKTSAMRTALEDAGAVFVRIDDMMMVGVRPGQGASRSPRARSLGDERIRTSTVTREDSREN